MSQEFGKAELLHTHFQLPPSFHLRWLHLKSAELFCRLLFHPVIVKPKSTPYYCFPELPSSCSRAPSAPPHTSSFTMAILAEPFHPSCLKSSAGSLSVTSVALSTQASAPLSDFVPHMWLFSCPATCPTTPAVGFLPTSPSATSDKPWKTFVLKHWKFMLRSLHSKEKLLPQLYQLTGKEQRKFVKLTRLTLNTSLQKYFSLQMFCKLVCFA